MIFWKIQSMKSNHIIGSSLVIKKSTTSKQVSLITRSLGRGVDFIVNDDKVIDNGGVHVIQTFLSKLTETDKIGSTNGYISKRDYTAFEDIFSLFGVTDKITYSTFEDLCGVLITEGGDVRTLTNQFINNKLNHLI
ncbi:hypothetical protein PPL_09763 [Heterostelium album PN500]|uniref:Uncharacterized protein n=1 Tax=Heterostelium pallidum (strain ATCC 26659 / Pp 5 / PN500) TaxID=670386 RepID=D3BP01_HETP5|nr:hypothetical protein PPL_09763 [Heterostelium album PN500]EFA77011.1 hypothetical protein PPL_09763 [Heterostelium album PN500]|eukprot:XP_020429141.1 hypothetical protein PPL_09763 [Heterostelium album PN500]